MPRSTQCPYFYFFPDDFSSDRNVEAMTTEEVGAYMLLICKSWREEPVASIPDDDRILARWTRLSPEQWSACRASVLAAFKLGRDGRWHQKRLRLEYDKLRRIQKNRSEAGKAGAEARHNKARYDNELDSGAIAEPKQTQDFAIPNAQHTVLTGLSSVSSSVSVSVPPNARDVMDEQWSMLRKCAIDRDVLPGSPEDWREARYKWGVLDMGERLSALADVQQRPADSPELKSLPQNYFKQKKWGRPMPHDNSSRVVEKSPADTARERAAMRFAERQAARGL